MEIYSYNITMKLNDLFGSNYEKFLSERHIFTYTTPIFTLLVNIESGLYNEETGNVI